MLNKENEIKEKSAFTYESFRVCNIEMSGPTFKLNFFIFFFFNTQQNKHCFGSKVSWWQVKCSEVTFLFFFVVVCLFVYHIFLAVLDSLVLLGLQLLLPGLVQVNQSLVVENKENEVQRICGDADDAEVL